ncbi:MAG: NAD-dependent epimerase/dehydratase family protein, partial [Flavobacteriaceae bacterium]|nr:NAD-dependent epimerase/dehydratase family protein [Flavobacteriaceae bacterium]
MAYSYCHLFKIKCTGLRFFTVYGPWGRPDMAPILFTDAITQSHPIKIFNNGDLYRDFTYIDDVIGGIFKIIEKEPSKSGKKNLYNIFNIGASHPIKLMDFIDLIEQKTGAFARKKFLPMQDGDVYKTYADVTNLKNKIDYVPTTSLDKGIEKFISWYKKYYVETTN